MAVADQFIFENSSQSVIYITKVQGIVITCVPHLTGVAGWVEGLLPTADHPLPQDTLVAPRAFWSLLPDYEKVTLLPLR